MVESKTQFCLKLSDKMFSVSLNHNKRNKQLKVSASIWCSNRRITARSGETAQSSFIFFSFNRLIIVCFLRVFYILFEYNNLIVCISCDYKIKPIRHWCSLMLIFFSNFFFLFLFFLMFAVFTVWQHFLSLAIYLVQLFPLLVLWSYYFVLFKD